ncbi:hypothetical protein GLAREA_01035 [Glarea lozoyensis ATCC 20868]|uniref:Uncharacterized protein n=1 Tax=Glarea lozoyensis (strain ATCC 20868 / MF5171) TaxID=1116229 RepID=S3CW78_GLAL2|nr:uncharacterized protein GLAREA_01035 [Glarea lozoyensis ATCC 20868]EPE29875.1 hypothetical protein GLAREA_01035 [Glarea lozoyensis ATCC 20868]
MVLFPADGGLIEVRLVKLTGDNAKAGYFEEYASIKERDPFDDAKVFRRHRSSDDKNCIVDEDLIGNDESDIVGGLDGNASHNGDNSSQGADNGDGQDTNNDDKSDGLSENVGEKKTPGLELKRFIVAQEACYGVEITLRKGFSHGRYYGGFTLILIDLESDKVLYNERIFEKSLQRSYRALEKHERFTVKTLPAGIVGGELKVNVALAFHAMNPDEKSEDSQDVDVFAGLRVQIHRFGRILAQKPTMFELDGMTNTHQNIAQKLHGKPGITKGLSLSGGHNVEDEHAARRRTPYYWITTEIEQTLKIDYFPRAADYLERNGFEKTPIKLERRPWDCLSVEERPGCFRKLQLEDQRRERDHEIVLAELEAHTGRIRGRILDEGICPNKWRSWALLMRRERPLVFMELQKRLRYFWKGEIPPEDLREIKLLESRKRQATSGEKPEVYHTEKEKQGESSGHGQPETISLLSDSEDEQIFEHVVPSLPAPRRANSVIDEQRPAKRIKLEPASNNQMFPVNLSQFNANTSSSSSETNLRRLKQRARELEEGLIAAQTVADMLRARNEMNARIAAMEEEEERRPSDGRSTIG